MILPRIFLREKKQNNSTLKMSAARQKLLMPCFWCLLLFTNLCFVVGLLLLFVVKKLH